MLFWKLGGPRNLQKEVLGRLGVPGGDEVLHGTGKIFMALGASYTKGPSAELFWN